MRSNKKQYKFIRFTAVIRFLLGNTTRAAIGMNSQPIKISIVTEKQARQAHQLDECPEPSSDKIINNTGVMEYNVTTKKFFIRNMQLKKVERAEKKGDESVMDEKFSLLFQSSFTIGHDDLEFSVWTLSRPVVVIVHSNQEPRSWATITWDNATTEIGRVPFVVPDKVPWNRLAETLNMKIRASTGRQLTADNLHFLAEKSFKKQIPAPISDDYQITWSQFCKEPLPERTFSFWEWFYASMKLIREHLRGPWEDDSIVGFIHKRTAEDVLLKCARGTFLLRFSDSVSGKIFLRRTKFVLILLILNFAFIFS
jgi:signal transducer and activator of transcription 5B